jgi:type IV pilus assembly protein PilV
MTTRNAYPRIAGTYRRNRQAAVGRESGSFILEALVSLLIFSLALLGLVGLSVQALNQVGQSKARNDASFLASELISDMWVSAAVNIDTWDTRVKASIPGATTNVHFSSCNCDTTATATYACTSTGASGGAALAAVTGAQAIASPLAVTVCISWVDRKEPTYPRKYQTSSMITRN